MDPRNLLLILEIVNRLLTQAGQYAALARQAAAENRDISDDEVRAMQQLDDAAKNALDAAIAARRQADAAGGNP